MHLREIAVSRYPALQSPWIQAALLSTFIFLIYLATSAFTTSYDHYVRLVDAFFHGRLYLVDAPEWLELARYGEKGYVINPPAPTLFLLPWVAIWGLGTNQAIVSMMVGAAAMGLFWIATGRLQWDTRFRLGITALLAFGTNFWWASSNGSVWMFAHVSAVFFLMAGLVETTGKNRPWLIGILVGLAGLSRLPAFLAFPFFAYMIGKASPDRSTLFKRLAIFGLALAFLGFLYILYTYGEYGTFNLGYERGQFVEGPWFSRGLFSIYYIPRHLEAIFLNPPEVSGTFPYIEPSFMGMGLFLTTPAFLYMFRRIPRGLALAALAGLFGTLVPIITYGVTGWLQFGYRFSLDFLLFLGILTASGMQYRLGRFSIALIALSIAINLWGTLAFNRLGWIAGLS